MSDVRFADWGPGGEDQLRELYAAVFPGGPKSAAGVIEWQYWSNPFGRSICRVALAGDRVVAHLLAWRLPVVLGDRAVTAGLFIDTSTHPEYRGRGIYFELKRQIAAAARDAGWEFVFSNPVHERGAGRAAGPGWVPLPRPRLFVRPIQAQWTELQNRVPAWGRRLALLWGHRARAGGERSDTVPEGLDDLVARLWTDTDNGMIPSARWWDWRFARHPAQPYRFFEQRTNGRLAAAGVTRLTDHEHPTIHVLDLVADSDEAARAVLSAAVADAPHAGGITLRATPQGLQGRAARAAGLIRVPDRLRGRQSHIGISVLLDDRVLTRVGLPWSVTAGNLDWG